MYSIKPNFWSTFHGQKLSYLTFLWSPDIILMQSGIIFRGHMFAYRTQGVLPAEPPPGGGLWWISLISTHTYVLLYSIIFLLLEIIQGTELQIWILIRTVIIEIKNQFMRKIKSKSKLRMPEVQVLVCKFIV